MPLPTGDGEQSDFLVELGRSRFLIEEKTKFDDPLNDRKRAAALAAGDVHLTVRPLVRTNRLSGIVRKAVDQLASSGATYTHNYKLLWFSGTGEGAEAYYHQFIATLYGTTNVWEFDGGMTNCYFFRNSEFHRYSEELDGAVAAYAKGGKLSARLCLNPLSPRVNGLRRTKFVKLFGTAVEDPAKRERADAAYVLNSSTDRSNEGALLEELQRKYKTQPLMKFDLGHHSAAVAVEPNEG